MNKTLIANSRILVVDDNFETLSFIGKIFTELHLKIFSASNGKQAIAIAQAKAPDLILLDVTMPDMGGFDVCRQLKAAASTTNIPIIFITGKTDSEDIEAGFNAGGVDYITKPFNKEELILRVFTHLELVKMQEKILNDNEIMHFQEMELLQKEKEKFEYKLSYAQKEIENTMLQIKKMSSVFYEMTEQIKQLLNLDGVKIKEQISPILHNAAMQLESNNWNEIEARFLKVHDNFFEKMLKHYPDLTKNELKLCAYLRLNLSTKEISALTLQSEESIKKARYRLRQKLNSDTDNSLCNLILQV